MEWLEFRRVLFRSIMRTYVGIVGGGVHLGPLGTAATSRPIAPAPGDYDGEIGGILTGRGNRSTSKEPAPVPLCPPQTPHACPDANPGRRGGKPAPNPLSCGTAWLIGNTISEAHASSILLQTLVPIYQITWCYNPEGHNFNIPTTEFRGGGGTWVHLVRRPLFGLLYQPRIIDDVWSSRWNENWQGKPKYSEKTCPTATLSTTNPPWPDLGSNPGRRGEKQTTNHLSYGTPSPPHYLKLYITANLMHKFVQVMAVKVLFLPFFLQ
jgi:hypothetical protein